MSRRTLYRFILTLSLAGYLWIFLNSYRLFNQSEMPDVCLFKAVTGIPCPSCGTTRSVLSLLQGNVSEAFFFNPLGFVILSSLLIVPVWILKDIIVGAESFYLYYQKAEGKIRTLYVAAPLVTIIVMNWCWNIYKGL